MFEKYSLDEQMHQYYSCTYTNSLRTDLEELYKGFIKKMPKLAGYIKEYLDAGIEDDYDAIYRLVRTSLLGYIGDSYDDTNIDFYCYRLDNTISYITKHLEFNNDMKLTLVDDDTTENFKAFRIYDIKSKNYMDSTRLSSTKFADYDKSPLLFNCDVDFHKASVFPASKKIFIDAVPAHTSALSCTFSRGFRHPYEYYMYCKAIPYTVEQHQGYTNHELNRIISQYFKESPKSKCVVIPISAFSGSFFPFEITDDTVAYLNKKYTFNKYEDDSGVIVRKNDSIDDDIPVSSNTGMTSLFADK